MTSSTSPAALEFVLRPSRGLTLYLWVLYLLACSATILATPLPLWLLPLTLLGAGPALRFLQRRLRAGPHALSVGEQGWRLHFGDGERRAELYQAHLQPWLLALWFRLEDGRRQKLLICADQLDREVFRRLRVAVRFAGSLD